ncbi:aromatic ring-hydroxylating dioxygenase subunit alpha [Sphingomonas sp. SRS2]|uniref:aromatic ring-hydroxylating dioxygenase subunit alpha n=1 Tax=Sphingomonas sp. SRS2 TaxID=133190 RepID=UPI0006184E75|nr:aromatic ring-hydroxylating dioxygenase subunit alpha [Sphingomonas sp. SRS2]KKC23919.1 hypothetical protein WP12_22135 [Sphingomonas sp. SRS2]
MTFVEDGWYVVALPEEVSLAPFARTILDQPLVMFRQEDGTPTVLLDICPHRFAPLSLGSIRNGVIQCPYHGLEFDAAGKCVHNPHGNGARPASLKVRHFPTAEQHNLVWAWLGDVERADPATIPDFSFRIDPTRVTIGGHATVQSNYRLLVDNLMDLSHAQFLHRANVESDAFDNVQRSIHTVGDDIIQEMTISNSTVTRLHASLFETPGQKIDFFSDIRWSPVSAMSNMIGVVATGMPKDGSFNSFGTHIITPETETSCHYFYASSRNYAVGDRQADDLIRNWQRQALMAEDKPVAEAIEARKGAARRNGMKPAMLSIDEAAVKVSRAIDKLAERV